MNYKWNAGENRGVPPADDRNYRLLDTGIFVPAELAERLRRIDLATVKRYAEHLRQAGKAAATVQKYCHDLRAFALFLGERYVSVSLVREWLALAIRGTGIRVSELQYFTVEAVREGVVNVDNKGKARAVFIDPETKTMLLRYCERAGISGGVIFCSRKGRPLSRAFIWRALKRLGEKAGVALSKVFPHNLRHLFAVERYRLDHDIESLRLDLGHSLIATTQRYLKETMSAHFSRLQRQAARQTA